MTAFGRHVANVIRQRAGCPGESDGQLVDEHLVPDFDGGARATPAARVDMNQRIRRAAGFGG